MHTSQILWPGISEKICCIKEAFSDIIYAKSKILKDTFNKYA